MAKGQGTKGKGNGTKGKRSALESKRLDEGFNFARSLGLVGFSARFAAAQAYAGDLSALDGQPFEVFMKVTRALTKGIERRQAGSGNKPFQCLSGYACRIFNQAGKFSASRMLIKPLYSHEVEF